MRGTLEKGKYFTVKIDHDYVYLIAGNDSISNCNFTLFNRRL